VSLPLPMKSDNIEVVVGVARSHVHVRITMLHLINSVSNENILWKVVLRKIYTHANRACDF